MSEKRDGYITWDEYFMGVAKLSAMRSKDPNTQVGACIVSQDNKILSMGYNGFPKGCSDDEFPWDKMDEDPYNRKYFYVTHSELNAILNYRGGSLEGSKLYVTLFPCNECAKAIIQAGIQTIVYESDKYANDASTRASKRMLNAAGVRYYQYNPDKDPGSGYRDRRIYHQPSDGFNFTGYLQEKAGFYRLFLLYMEHFLYHGDRPGRKESAAGGGDLAWRSGGVL